MGDFYLWGYYNTRPVFQHSSGLDFLYFHKNSVWGIGPKIGGNSAGLLNFGNHICPYALRLAAQSIVSTPLIELTRTVKDTLGIWHQRPHSA